MKFLLVLVVITVISALGVVHMKYRTRLMFSEVQRLQTENEAYDEEMARLQFEQNKWSERERVERESQLRLHMILPEPTAIISIRP